MSRHGASAENYHLFARNIDWNLFKQFREIVRSGGITAAARSLNRQQPTISAALKRLEDHFGVPLCERTPRGITLNSAGSILFDTCEQIHALVAKLPPQTATASQILAGSIAVRMISDLVSPELDAATIHFHQAHPHVEIRWDIAPWREVVSSVKAGAIDIGIACDSSPSADLHYESLVQEIQQLYCGPTHPLFGRPALDPRELVDQQFILTGQDEPEDLEHFRRRYGLGRRVGGFAETLNEVKRLIQLGIGLGFLPMTVAREAQAAGLLWPLLHSEILPRYDVFLITREVSTLSAATRTLLTMIAEHRRPNIET